MEHEHRANLRLSAETYESIDDLRKRLPGNVSRNTWIAIAIQEKIDRAVSALQRPAPQVELGLNEGKRDA
ncbi:MAG: hypothetical protein Q7R40_12025 [Phaeospirillum sp.]|nr:hypothetical protein [Phaeospirillum sp.]